MTRPTTLNTGVVRASRKFSTGRPGSPTGGQANAEQHGHQQHLQDVVAHEGLTQRLGNDVQRKSR